MKKIVLLLLCFVLIISVNAACNNYGEVSWWSMDNLSDNCGLNDITSNNGAEFVADCVFGGCYDFERSESDNMIVGDRDTLEIADALTIAFWTKVESLPPGGATNRAIQSYGYVLDMGYNSGGYQQKTRIDQHDGGGFEGPYYSAQAYGIDVWQHIMYTFKDGQVNIYHDNVLNNSYSDGAYDIRVGGSDYFLIGCAGGTSCSAHYYDGMIDELRVFNKTLNETERAMIYNFNRLVNVTGGGAPGVTPSITLDWNITAGLYPSENFAYSFNASIVNNSNNYDCNLSMNGTEIYNNVSTDIIGNLFWNFSTDNYQGENNFVLCCVNTNASDCINQSSVFIDTVQPLINIKQFNPNSTYYSDTNYQVNISLTDSNLAAYLLEIFQNISGSYIIKYNISNYNIGSSPHEINNITNSSIWCSVEPCSYVMNVTAWDDHNPVKHKHEKAKEIQNLGDGKLKFKFKGGDVDIYSDDVDEYSIYDEDNKYKIEYTFKHREDNLIILENHEQWFYRNTEHKAHFYNPTVKKYFDLNSPGITIKSINYNSDGWYIYLDVDKVKVKTNSIGDLNVNTVTTSFVLNERPDLNEALLLNMTILLSDLNETNSNIEEAINMLWVIFLLIGCGGLLFVFARELNTGENQHLAIIKNGIYIVGLFFILGFMGLGLRQMQETGFNQNVINIFIGLFIGICFIIIPTILLLVVLFIKSLFSYIQQNTKLKFKGYDVEKNTW